MQRSTFTLIVLAALCLALPVIGGAVTVTSKAQFLAELPLTPGKTITITNQTISGGGAWGAINITGDCTQASPCRIEAQTSRQVIFSGQGAGTFNVMCAWCTIAGLRHTGQTNFGDAFSSTGASGGTLYALDGAQNATLDDFQIDNISGGGNPIAMMTLNSARQMLNVTLSNGLIDGVTQSASMFVIYIYAQTDRGYNVSGSTYRFPEGITLSNMTLSNRTVTINSNNCCYWIRAGNGQDSINSARYASGNSNIVLSGVTIQNDTPAGGGVDTAHFKATNVRIEDSTFIDTTRLVIRQGTGAIIQRNTFKNPDTQYNGEFMVLYSAGHTVANNLFYTTTGSKNAIKLGKGNTDNNGDGRLDYTAASNMFLLNNTFDGFTQVAITAVSNSSGNKDGTTTVFPSSITFHNNVVRQQLGTMFDGPSGCGIFSAVSNNARSGAATADCMTSGTNNVTSAPLWADPNAGDYTLGAASPLVDAGIAVAGTTADEEDHEGNSVAGGVRDIGAFEFGGGSPPAGACDQIFSGATDYELCVETGTTCEFNVTLGGSDCATLCGSFGKDCTAAYDNTTPACTHQGTDSCSTVRTNEICVCTLADSGPPSPPGGTETVTQKSYRMYGALANDGAEPLAPENVNSAAYLNSRLHLVIAIEGDSGINTHLRSLTLCYQHCNPSCGSYQVITAACDAAPTCLLDNPGRASNSSAANNLALGGLSFNTASQYIDGEDPNGGEAVDISIAAGDQVELGFAARIGMTAAQGDIINYQVCNVDGSPLDAYDVTPSLEVGSGQFYRAGGSQQ